MLTGLRLGNFKAFGETQRIPIRPLTLIFGANSAGKSSLIHGLLLARHGVDTGELDVHRTVIGGDSVDLGGFRQYVHRRNIEHRVEWAIEIDVHQLQGRAAELLSSVKRICVLVYIGDRASSDKDLFELLRSVSGEAMPEVIAYEIEADGVSLLRMSRRPGGILRLDRLEHEHPVFREVLKAIVETTTTTEAIKEEDFEGLEEAVNELVPELAFHMGNLLPTGLLEDEQPVDKNEQPALFPISRGRRKEDLAAAVRFFLPRTIDAFIHDLNEAISGELKRVHYLGPLRSYPPRHLAFSQHHDPNWFSGGGYAWDVVRRVKKVREAVNTWLGSPDRLQTPYELVVRELVGIDELEVPLLDGLEEVWVEEENPFERFGNDREGIARQLRDEIQNKSLRGGIDTLKELVLIDRRSNTTVSHRDVGIGISQVLPVLVGAYGSKEKILAIEQPEIHLHPALQAELGDVFIESALGERKNTFLIETHSEHLILRLMRRMRDTFQGKLPDGLPPVRPQDVAILYVQPKGASAVVRVLELDEEGQFLDPWPGGFFEEGFRERFS